VATVKSIGKDVNDRWNIEKVAIKKQAGDIACDPLDSHYNFGNGTVAYCMQKATSDLLANGGFAAVLALGDTQYYCGGLSAFQQVYDATWGRVKSITHPVVGNHEYLTTGSPTGATGCDNTNANAAGYYSYLWSEALDADAFEAFEEAGDDFDPELAERLKRFVYAAGNTREPDEAYRRFRGADPSPDALLRKRGLAEV